MESSSWPLMEEAISYQLSARGIEVFSSSLADRY
jgi:hypothetical protein